jgi:hypothetical protein
MGKTYRKDDRYFEKIKKDKKIKKSKKIKKLIDLPIKEFPNIEDINNNVDDNC